MALAMEKVSAWVLPSKGLPDPDSGLVVYPARDRPSCQVFWQLNFWERGLPVLAGGANVPGRYEIRFLQTLPDWLRPTGTNCTDSLPESCGGQHRCRWLANYEPIAAGRATWARLRLLGPETVETPGTPCSSSAAASGIVSFDDLVSPHRVLAMPLLPKWKNRIVNKLSTARNPHCGKEGLFPSVITTC